MSTHVSPDTSGRRLARGARRACWSRRARPACGQYRPVLPLAPATQTGTRGLISLWDSLMFGRVPGTRPNMSESHSEISTRVPFCIAGAWRQHCRARAARCVCVLPQPAAGMQCHLANRAGITHIAKSEMCGRMGWCDSCLGKFTTGNNTWELFSILGTMKHCTILRSVAHRGSAWNSGIARFTARKTPIS